MLLTDELYFRKDIGLMMVAYPLVFLLASWVSLRTGDLLPTLTTGFMLWSGFKWMKQPVIAFSDCQLRVSTSLLGSAVVSYRDIQAIEQDGNKVVVTAGGQRMRLPLSALSSADQDAVRSKLTELLARGETKDEGGA